MKKISTVQAFGNEIFKEQRLTIGLDLGDRWWFYCIRDEGLDPRLPASITGGYGFIKIYDEREFISARWPR